ncbi:hypothetical protein ACLOJK_020040 [Asimina triloba]
MVEVDQFREGFFIDFDEEEEEFRSCFAEDDEWRDLEESIEDKCKEEFDEFTLKMFFKGVSIAQDGDPGRRASGIGVVMERSQPGIVHHIQKKLDFYVEESVANHLALMDGLLEALRSDVSRVLAYTDSKIVYDQVAQGEGLENQLLTALAQRILELTSNLETFVLQLVPTKDLLKPLRLAQDAIGFSSEGNDSLNDCPICCEENSQVPIRCPQFGCKHYISAAECKSFLPADCYESFQRALAEVGILDAERIYCPYPNCSVLLLPHEFLTTRASSSSHFETSCVDCPECGRFICINCRVPWHSSMNCEEYQNLPVEDRDAEDIALHRLALNQRWRQCQQCRRMIELTQGCYHMTCWCGHEFCYSCGAEYHDGHQTCHCNLWDEDDDEDDDSSVALASPVHEPPEPWRWDSFDSLPAAMDGYSEQERSQLALIQRFLTGGFSLSDHHAEQSPPRCSDSYVDTMKDLHQLPWLERFVSVISDNYYEDYVQ